MLRDIIYTALKRKMLFAIAQPQLLVFALEQNLSLNNKNPCLKQKGNLFKILAWMTQQKFLNSFVHAYNPRFHQDREFSTILAELQAVYLQKTSPKRHPAAPHFQNRKYGSCACLILSTPLVACFTWVNLKLKHDS